MDVVRTTFPLFLGGFFRPAWYDVELCARSAPTSDGFMGELNESKHVDSTQRVGGFTTC